MSWNPSGLSAKDYLKISKFTPQEQAQADILSFGYKYSKLTPQQIQDIQIAQGLKDGSIQVADTIKINPGGTIVPSNPIGDTTWGPKKGQSFWDWYKEQFKKIGDDDPWFQKLKDLFKIPGDLLDYWEKYKIPITIIGLLIIYKILF